MILSGIMFSIPYSKIMFQNYIPYSKITFQNHIPCSKIIFQNHISNSCSKSQPTKKFHVPYSMVHVPQKNEPTNEPHINSNRERRSDLWNQRRIPPTVWRASSTSWCVTTRDKSQCQSQFNHLKRWMPGLQTAILQYLPCFIDNGLGRSLKVYRMLHKY